jgi:AraC-like DNA-binding protein
LFFYIRGTLKDQTGLKPKDLIHFAPALLTLIGVLPYYLIPFSEKKIIAAQISANLDVIKTLDLNLFFTMTQNFLLRIVLFFTYLGYSIYLLWKFSPYKTSKNQPPLKQSIISYRFLVALCGVSLFLLVNFFILTLDFFKTDSDTLLTKSVLANINSGVAFVFIALSILLFPEVLYGMPVYKKRKNKKRNFIATESKPATITVPKFKAVTVPEEDPFFELAERIKTYLEVEKPYLSPKFAMGDIAVALQVYQNHVGYCFNSIMKVKFIKLKNQLRVAHAKKLLVDPAYTNLTIDAIAEKSGFTSRSNFYTIFKSEMGYTPSDFLKMNSLSFPEEQKN